MIFGLFTLITALIISAVAAYYSIIGLTAIFSAAFWPIVIMGTALEVGKIVAVTWLHNYWDQAGWKIKSYLMPAVLALMLITSMGIFGFLSKAHSDQTIVSGDAGAKVTLLDERIKTERENIEVARAAIQQMNNQVNELLARGTTEENAQRAANLRRSQAAERNRLQREIAQAQTQIQKLQEERAPLASSLRKIEAEVGPIKYIAAMIYGDNPDSNLLERAVRWMIILIVLVFDPLAITLILAANKNFEWARTQRKENKEKESKDHHSELLNEKNALIELLQKELDEHKKDQNLANEKIVDANDKINTLSFNYSEAVDEIKRLKQQLDEIKKLKPNEEKKYDDSVPPIWEQLIKIGKNYPESPSTANVKTVAEEEFVVKDSVPEETTGIREKQKSPLDLTPSAIEKTEIRTRKARPVSKNELNNLMNKKPPNSTFGKAFPKNPSVGDVVLRIDSLPHRLFKWNGTSWIEIDKNQSSSYAYDQEYIKYLIDKIASGEYDIDDLNATEQEQIKKFLEERNNDQTN